MQRDHERAVAHTRAVGLHRDVAVDGRFLSLPLERYATGMTFGEANDLWVATALEVGEQAIGNALAEAGIDVRDVDAIFFSTVTGVDVYLCIVTIGVMATVYTVLGGMEAVVWTDVLQVVVLMVTPAILLVVCPLTS